MSQSPSRNTLPVIDGPLSPHPRNNRLSSSFIQRRASEPSKTFVPPNISAFKSLGPEGSLLNTKNQRTQKSIEANLVETRVKKLLKEEQKMLKKIEMTRQQATKMAKLQEEKDMNYRYKMELRKKREMDIEEQRLKNKAQKEKSQGLKIQKQAAILASNRMIYNQVSEVKSHFQEDKIYKNQDVQQRMVNNYSKQREQEIRLKNKTLREKEQRVIESKMREDTKKAEALQRKKMEEERLKMAAEREQELIMKLQNTMSQQQKAAEELQQVMSKNKIKRSDRIAAGNGVNANNL